MKLVLLFAFLFSSSLQAACETELIKELRKTSPDAEMSLKFITTPAIHLERRLVDLHLAEVCIEEIEANQYAEPTDRMACNLISQERPIGLTWFGVNFITFVSDMKIHSKKLLGLDNSCRIVYHANTFLTHDQAD